VAKSNHAAREALRLWLAGGALPRPADQAAAGALVEAALEQGVAGLLRTALDRYAGWPEASRARLADAQRAHLVRGVAQLELAARATRELEAAGVRALPLKGTALAETLYDSVADRPMGDVDLLALDDWAAAVEALREAGWREAERADHAWVFRDPPSGEILELHHGLTSCPGLFRLEPDALWSRRRRGPEPIAWVPSPEDVLLQLSLHAAFQHGLVLRLGQYLDLQRLLRRPLDAGRAAELSRRARAGGAVAAALLAAQRVLGIAVPAALAAAFAPDLPAGLGRWIRAQPASAFIWPAPAAVFRVRWALARGRRLRFAALTLSPVSPLGEPGGRRLVNALARSAGLLERWGPWAWRPAALGGRTRVG
jgi:hypothetical protein